MTRLSKVVLAVCLVLAVLICRLLLQESAARFSIGPSLPPGKVQPQLISASDQAVLLAPDGSLWVWGGTRHNFWGLFGANARTERPRPLGNESDWATITANDMNILAVKSDGSLWICGANSILAGGATNLLKLTRFGADTDWQTLSIGVGHCLALKRDGSLWAWGQNDRGQVGDASKDHRSTPVRISGSLDWRAVSAGNYNSFALRGDGTIWGWGRDPVAGGTNDDLAPRQFEPGTNWAAIAAGAFHLIALKRDGTLWIGGRNADRIAPKAHAIPLSPALVQVGTNSHWAEIYSGLDYFIARKSDGSWWGAGNRAGQLGLGHFGKTDALQRLPHAYNPWALAAGGNTTLLLAKDGTLWNCGIRIGTPERSERRQRNMTILNDVLELLRLHRRIFNEAPHPCDRHPAKIWELPDGLKAQLLSSSQGDAPKP
jgi:alpha-tubulin suppressor-like RCC1 family protein